MGFYGYSNISTNHPFPYHFFPLIAHKDLLFSEVAKEVL